MNRYRIMQILNLL